MLAPKVRKPSVNEYAGAYMMQAIRIVLGTLLATQYNPAFWALTGFVGAGLMFAGISGTCMMANILAKMPWN